MEKLVCMQWTLVEAEPVSHRLSGLSTNYVAKVSPHYLSSRPTYSRIFFGKKLRLDLRRLTLRRGLHHNARLGRWNRLRNGHVIVD